MGTVDVLADTGCPHFFFRLNVIFLGAHLLSFLIDVWNNSIQVNSNTIVIFI